MVIITPVIGIPEYWWHKKAFKYAKNNPNLVEIDIDNLCYECHRHKDILNNFDNDSNNFDKTEYWKYYESTKNNRVIMAKIVRYEKLYNKIKKNSYVPYEDLSSIIITDDGCRLDGSHRLAILEHMNVSKVIVNIFYYEKIFSKKESQEIRKVNKRYRKEMYGL